MHPTAEILLWASLAIVVYCYVVYPPLIWCLSRLFGSHREAAPLREDDLPGVTLLIAAHNEERWIGQRVENALAADYPRARLEILVASDGSRDATVAIAERYVDRGVRVLDFRENRGKATALNAAMLEARHPLVVFSDANTFFEPGALRHLVSWFTDPAVGAVCGRLVLIDPAKGRNVDSLYWKYETFMKKCESRLGALLGANGAIYALRKSDYVPILPDTLVDDFTIPLVSKLKTGKAIVFDSHALAWEECPPAIRDEFRRRSRIGAGGYQAVVRLLPLLSPAHGWIGFAFFSHKILRWLCPFFLILALGANLLCLESPAYVALLSAQLAFYLVSLAGALVPGQGIVGRLVRLPAMFTSMNVALLIGFWNWLFSQQRGVWQRTAR